MRIIAGSFRSRVLVAPPGMSTRPTSDRLRETLFNVLAPRISGAAFLDLYAGSGAVGIEALSRGASFVNLVERAPAVLKVLRGNLEQLGIDRGFRTHSVGVGTYLRAFLKSGPKRERYEEVVFMDPPWEAEQEYAATLGLLGSSGAELLSPGAIVIAEHRRKLPLDERYGNLRRTRLLEQGDAALSFYAVDAVGAAIELRIRELDAPAR
jgi:16S rRNA (guanine966-N2)-methyltransferase